MLVRFSGFKTAFLRFSGFGFKEMFLKCFQKITATDIRIFAVSKQPAICFVSCADWQSTFRSIRFSDDDNQLMKILSDLKKYSERKASRRVQIDL
jgi:hypothetical protein